MSSGPISATPACLVVVKLALDFTCTKLPRIRACTYYNDAVSSESSIGSDTKRSKVDLLKPGMFDSVAEASRY